MGPLGKQKKTQKQNSQDEGKGLLHIMNHITDDELDGFSGKDAQRVNLKRAKGQFGVSMSDETQTEKDNQQLSFVQTRPDTRHKMRLVRVFPKC